MLITIKQNEKMEFFVFALFSAFKNNISKCDFKIRKVLFEYFLIFKSI